MAEDSESGAASVPGAGSTTLSQLMAKILGQLSLSAWLPSAALVLVTAFVLQLGSVIDKATPPAMPGGSPSYVTSPRAATNQAFAALSKTSVSGLILLVAVITVVTMVTQAFAFESIRFLEGYWGSAWLGERLGGWRSKYWAKKRRGFQKRHDALTKEAWKRAKRVIAKDSDFTENMLAVLEAQVLGGSCSLPLTEREEGILHSEDWRKSAPREVMRRRLNLALRLDDFPERQNVMPTKLGNVLRRFEDDTGHAKVESMVEDVFHSLPMDMQTSHDEQRARVELYCSMQFVLTLVTALAIVRFGLRHWGYTLTAVLMGLVGLGVLYRAAVASARYYGLVLVSIANFIQAA